MKIAIIGAGGYVFPLRLIGDILSFPELRDLTLSLMDMDLTRVKRTASASRELVEHYAFSTTIETTTDRKEALDGADYVIITFQVGGVEAHRHDVKIPRRYGLDQPVGDTLGPGGVFRFLRSAPAYKNLADDMHALCPRALLINYANPMAMNCWYLSELGINVVGLCHSVQGTSRFLARSLGVPYGEVRYLAAGINHQAWFLKFGCKGEDLLPQLREVLGRRYLRRSRAPGSTDQDSKDQGYHSDPERGESDYEGAQERVRSEIMTAFGYFHTESSHHASEYLPYFRKNPQLVDNFIPQRWDYYEICAAYEEGNRTQNLLEQFKTELKASVEYGAQIIHSVETGQPRVVYGNVANDGLISNLPSGCCVEVPCLVDGNGLQPTAVGALPPQCAAVNLTNINVQALAVRAVLEQNPAHILHAIMLDPLTGALLTLQQIRAMVGEMLGAEAQWLPPFAVRQVSQTAVGAIRP